MSAARRFLPLAVVVVAAVLLAGMCRIADLDFWWHAKSGELIVRTGEIPRHDVFSYTAAGREYIDHEWLFQVIQYATLAMFGAAGIALLKCLVIATTMLLVAWHCVRRGADSITTAGLVFLAMAGGLTRMIERPEIFSTLFAVLTYLLVRAGSNRALAAIPLLAALWSNVHAAVIVGLLIQAIFILGTIVEQRAVPRRLVVTLLASVIATGANPFGYRVLLVPFELTRIIDSGLINNAEWRHPTFTTAPLFFVALAMAIVLLVRRRVDFPDIFIALFLVFLALRYVRNIGLFCTFLPMFAAGEAARLRREWRIAVTAIGSLALVLALTRYYPFERGIGEASYFPDGIVRFTREQNLRGHMINAYGFGGYLIWTLYPERRVFIDGRNEVYLPLLERVAAARGDSRVWNALLRDYQVEYALLDYTDELDRVVVFDAAGKSSAGYAPISATRFPRSRWALVDWDDDGMVFVRRNGVNASLAAREYGSVFPEGDGYQRQLVERGTVNRARAVAELQRKLVEDPGCRRARALLASIAPQNR